MGRTNSFVCDIQITRLFRTATSAKVCLTSRWVARGTWTSSSSPSPSPWTMTNRGRRRPTTIFYHLQHLPYHSPLTRDQYLIIISSKVSAVICLCSQSVAVVTGSSLMPHRKYNYNIDPAGTSTSLPLLTATATTTTTTMTTPYNNTATIDGQNSKCAIVVVEKSVYQNS